ncbi:unnamed protein product [Arabidopsis halleri]
MNLTWDRVRRKEAIQGRLEPSSTHIWMQRRELMIQNQFEVPQRSTQMEVFHCDLASELFIQVIGN